MASLVLATLTNDPQTALAMRTADPEALTAEMLAHEKQRWAPALADPVGAENAVTACDLHILM